jgi:hypothetical protein
LFRGTLYPLRITCYAFLNISWYATILASTLLYVVWLRDKPRAVLSSEYVVTRLSSIAKVNAAVGFLILALGQEDLHCHCKTMGINLSVFDPSRQRWVVANCFQLHFKLTLTAGQEPHVRSILRSSLVPIFISPQIHWSFCLLCRMSLGNTSINYSSNQIYFCR